MLNEIFLTDEQLDTVCGATQIPQKTTIPRTKTPTTNDLKVPPLVTIPIPFIRIDEVTPTFISTVNRPEGYTPKIPEHLIIRR